MKLKHAILERLSREDLKQISDRLEIEDVDRRSADDMRAHLCGVRRASPEMLLAFLSENEVKALAKAIGMDARGRKKELIKKLAAAGRSKQGVVSAVSKSSTTRRATVAGETQQYR